MAHVFVVVVKTFRAVVLISLISESAALANQQPKFLVPKHFRHTITEPSGPIHKGFFTRGTGPIIQVEEEWMCILAKKPFLEVLLKQIGWLPIEDHLPFPEDDLSLIRVPAISLPLVDVSKVTIPESVQVRINVPEFKSGKLSTKTKRPCLNWFISTLKFKQGIHTCEK